MTNASNKVPLEKVADDLHLSRLVTGWRKAVRRSYTKYIQPFMHGALCQSSAQSFVPSAAGKHCALIVATLSGVPDAGAGHDIGEGAGAAPEDEAQNSAPDADGNAGASTDEDEGLLYAGGSGALDADASWMQGEHLRGWHGQLNTVIKSPLPHGA